MPIDTKLDEKKEVAYSLASSGLEDVDYAVYEYINDELNIFVDTNTGFKKIPVLYAIPERAYQIKADPTLRPNGRTLEYPLISILRENITQNPENKGRYGVYIPPYLDYYNRGGSLEVARVVNQEKTRNFANSAAIKKSNSGTASNYKTFPGENKQIVYETLVIPMPSFVEVEYNVLITTSYQQQMNDVLAMFSTKTSTPSTFSIRHGGNRYEAFIEPSYTLDNNSAALGTDERLFKTGIKIMVLGYIIGAGKNQETPNVVRYQSAAKIEIQRERTILGDLPDNNVGRKDKYRP
jgi:hypothetical protein